MTNIPSQLRFTKTHEWVSIENGIATVGITDYAQHLLGDLVFVDLPAVETELTVGQECAVVESVKAASDVYAPVEGTVIEINENASADPALVNSDPYQKGWLYRVKLHADPKLDHLIPAAAYQTIVEECS